MQVTETLSEGLKREYQGRRSGRRSRRQGQCAARRSQRPRAHQRLPPGQGAGRASQAPLWPRDDGRGDRSDGARGQQPDRRPSAASSSPPSRRSRCREEKDAVEQLIAGKSDLDYTVAIEIVPPITLGRFQEHQARAADRRSRPTPRSTRRLSASPSRTSRSRRQAEGDKAGRATASSSPSQARSTASRSRAARATMPPVLIGSDTFIPGFEEQLIGIAAGENRTVKVEFPGALPGARSSPARTPSSPSPRSRSRRPARSRSTTISPSRSGWNRSPSCATRCSDRIEREHAAHVAPEGQARAARSARRDAQIRAAAVAGRGGIRPRVEVGAAGAREREARPSPTRTPPRRRPRRNTAPSPSGGCGSAWCSPRSARRTISRLPTRNSTGDDGARAPIPGPGAAGLGLLTAKSAGASPACARRSSRKRSSTSCSSSPR